MTGVKHTTCGNDQTSEQFKGRQCSKVSFMTSIDPLWPRRVSIYLISAKKKQQPDSDRVFHAYVMSFPGSSKMSECYRVLGILCSRKI